MSKTSKMADIIPRVNAKSFCVWQCSVTCISSPSSPLLEIWSASVATVETSLLYQASQTNAEFSGHSSTSSWPVFNPSVFRNRWQEACWSRVCLPIWFLPDGGEPPHSAGGPEYHLHATAGSPVSAECLWRQVCVTFGLLRLFDMSRLCILSSLYQIYTHRMLKICAEFHSATHQSWCFLSAWN